jgi:membrane protease YdiL (CAAX protease family)
MLVTTSQMNGLYRRFPVAARFLLALLLGVTALALTGLIGKVLPFPFIDVALLTLATWILYRTDGKSLKVLGLNITIKHSFFLILGLAIGIVALGLENLLRTIYTGEHWRMSEFINQGALWKGLYFILPSVVVQELMFRGYLFTKTIEVTNVATANVIFSILFMLVHVLDKDVLQNTGQLIFLLVSIPVGHLLFATALLKSKTLYFPIGLHWGNNWASSCLVGYGKNDNTFFHVNNPYVFTSWQSFVILLLIFNLSFLLLTFLIWKWKSIPANKTLLPTAALKNKG